MNYKSESRILKGEQPKGAATSLEALDKEEQRFILEQALERVEAIFAHTTRLYETAKQKYAQRSILELNNITSGLDPSANQKEILRGKFSIRKGMKSKE